MYKFPIRIPPGKALTISQGFKPETHIGNDVVCGDGPSTFGLPFVWPFPFPGKIYDSVADSPIAARAKQAHAQVDGTDPVTGISYSLLCIHLSSVVYNVAPGADSPVRFLMGETIGYLGNSGIVSPKPTLQNPFGGSHAHLGLGIKNPGEANYTMVDPSLYFDIANPFYGPDDPSRDNPVLEWAGIKPPVVTQFTREMGFGMYGEDVRALQKVLGMPESLQTGYFGYVTKGYVYLYQISNGITPRTGYVGPKTLAVLNIRSTL